MSWRWLILQELEKTLEEEKAKIEELEAELTKSQTDIQERREKIGVS